MPALLGFMTVFADAWPGRPRQRENCAAGSCAVAVWVIAGLSLLGSTSAVKV
jgi:hypothetical protein